MISRNFFFHFSAVISNNNIPRPPALTFTTTQSTTSTTSSTTTPTPTTTSTTTRRTSTRTPFTTSRSSRTRPPFIPNSVKNRESNREPAEEDNEVIRGRKVLDPKGRGRVKILVKKRPEAILEAATALASETQTENRGAASAGGPPTPKGGTPAASGFRRQRVRFMPTQIEVRTEKSVRTATSKSIRRQSQTLFSKRNGLLTPSGVAPPQIDEVIRAPPNLGGNVLMAIRSFCRRPPMEKDEPHCFRPEPLYFYNVTSASCEPFFKGHCARSRNKFESVQECQDKCLVTSRSTSNSASAISSNVEKSSKDSTSSSSTKLSSSGASGASSSPLISSRPSLFKARLNRRRGLF